MSHLMSTRKSLVMKISDLIDRTMYCGIIRTDRAPFKQCTSISYMHVPCCAPRRQPGVRRHPSQPQPLSSSVIPQASLPPKAARLSRSGAHLSLSASADWRLAATLRDKRATQATLRQRFISHHQLHLWGPELCALLQQREKMGWDPVL